MIIRGQYWHYQCDGCHRPIVAPDLQRPWSSLRALTAEGKFFERRSKHGRDLHYCSKRCLEKHFHPGKGTPAPK